MTRETAVTNSIKRALADAGAYVTKTHGGWFGGMGRPDLLACYQGAFIALEVKAPHRKAKGTAIQEHTLAEIRAAGGWAAVVTSAERVKLALRAWPFVCRHCLGKLVGPDDYDDFGSALLRCGDCGVAHGKA